MISIKQTIIFRADGNNEIGLGHIFRCLAISELFENEFEKHFITRNVSESLVGIINTYCTAVTIINEGSIRSEALAIAKLLQPSDIIVLDGYEFDTEYQSSIKSSGAKIIFIDDIHKFHFVADVVINHAGNINPKVYSIESGSRLYSGPAYAIVRSDFWNKPTIIRRIKNHVFVCLGGADPKNDLIGLLEKALQINNSLIYNIVVGSAYSFESELLVLLQKYPANLILHKNLKSIEMKQIMQQCSIAICSASTVSYEYLSIGGELYLYPIADNQMNIYKYFIQSSLGFAFEQFGVLTKQEIHDSLNKQASVFDGKSYIRLKEAILHG